MIEIANQLVQSLFKKNSLQECSRWELEILADKYPYFGIAQLLVTGKLKEENAEEFEKQVEKTSLYFTNPLWLDYILNKKQIPPGFHLPETNGQLQEVLSAGEDTVSNEIVERINTNDDPVRADIEEPVAAEAESLVSERKEDIPVTDPDIDADENKNDDIKIAPLKQEPLTDSNSALTFEPYHTVDYFASQGIKLSQEEKPQDRFGQQLKSFTQWLKTIKKTPPAEIAKELGKGGEQKIVTLAEHSLDDREVVTESMAEVWLKQGNKEKAIEVYDKLSLQNPAKSSYFASLIEQLKQH